MPHTAVIAAAPVWTALVAVLSPQLPEPAAPGSNEPRWYEGLSVSGWVGGAWQVQRASGANDEGGALLLRPSIELRVGASGRLHTTLGLPVGESLNGDTPFALSPWAADLECTAIGINGTGRDYLLTAWYGHELGLGDAGTLRLTGGLIDATEYLDQNELSNDELTQFMNAALVNSPNGFAPSYDPGAVVEWKRGRFGVTGVVMRVPENDAGRPYTFLGLQGSYRADTGLGEGRYRIYAGHRDDDSSAAGEPRTVLILSASQSLGERVAVWTRLGTQDRTQAGENAQLVSGGLQLDGRLWHRPEDVFGLGLAHLSVGGSGLESSAVLEAYLSLALRPGLALTLDAQHMLDRQEGPNPDLEGWVFGVRLGYSF